MAHLSRARAWAPAAKAAALFLLPFPLGFAVLAALITGDLDRLTLAGGALSSLWTAGVLAFSALAAEARYVLGERPDPPVVPLKLLSALLTGLGVALAALAGGHAVSGALVFAVLGTLGHAAFYGRDLGAPRIHVAAVDGVDVAAVTGQLKQAYGRLRAPRAPRRVPLTARSRA